MDHRTSTMNSSKLCYHYYEKEQTLNPRGMNDSPVLVQTLLNRPLPKNFLILIKLYMTMGQDDENG